MQIVLPEAFLSVEHLSVAARINKILLAILLQYIDYHKTPQLNQKLLKDYDLITLQLTRVLIVPRESNKFTKCCFFLFLARTVRPPNDVSDRECSR